MTTPINFRVNLLPDGFAYRWHIDRLDRQDEPPFIWEVSKKEFLRVVEYIIRAARGDKIKPLPEWEIQIKDDKVEMKISLLTREKVEGQHRMGTKVYETDGTLNLSIGKPQLRQITEYLEMMLPPSVNF